ncbi:MAG: RHS repeat protein [Planctomyces sp.]|nr:RHS repeat protein [Planctomyces sp.]
MSRSVPPRLRSDYKKFNAAVPFDAHISHRGRTQFCGSSLTISDVSGVTTMTYDANGNQETIEEPSGDLTTNTWDGENRLIQVEHPSGDIITYAYNGDGLRVLQDDGLTETRFVHDGNNVRQLTDSSQVVTDEYAFDAWGNTTSSTGSTANSQLWKGQYLAYRKDPDAGPELPFGSSIPARLDCQRLWLLPQPFVGD